MPPEKRLFVTIGATAPFNTLIRAVLAHGFLQALHDADYTELRIQHGDEGAHILREADLDNINKHYNLTVTGFDFSRKGLDNEFRALQNRNIDVEGAVLTHAGTGTILEGLRYGVPLIVVANEELLGNHQVELAEELSRLKYVVYGKMSDLPLAIPQAEKLRLEKRHWPPSKHASDKYEPGLKGVMDEEMGWVQSQLD